ncbi:hypothetical protein K0038_03590 [Pseudomonas syringae]|nr:hypothetical protein [Pseudomonas syringae]
MHAHAERENWKTIVPMLRVGMLFWTLCVGSSMSGLASVNN